MHRHLEGSVRVETIVEFAREHNVELPTYDVGELRNLVQAGARKRDFVSFLRTFEFLRTLYPSKDAIERVAYECVEDAGRENIRYLELRFSPAHFATRQGFDVEEVARWIESAVERAERDFGIRVGLIITLGRNYGVEVNAPCANIAIERQSSRYLGLDLAGDEINYPAAPFKPFFDRAADAGLGITIHAGEASGAGSVREAVEELHATRIGHGIRVLEDSSLVQLCRERGVGFEVCPSSNYYTGVSSIENHPLRRLMKAGLTVSIGSDDPTITGTDLNTDYELAVNRLGLSLQELMEVVLAGVRVSFLPGDEKKVLENQLRDELRQLLGSEVEI